MEGYGNKIVKLNVDWKVQTKPEFPAELSGNHFIKMVLNGVDFPEQKINKLKNITSPATPIVKYTSHKLSWEKVDNAITYIIIKNGNSSTKTSQTYFTVTADTYAEYQDSFG